VGKGLESNRMAGPILLAQAAFFALSWLWPIAF
jgi:hypothetical protein